jgi:uncharacterized SAM-binding protein YcdF (DUF218 family)
MLSWMIRGLCWPLAPGRPTNTSGVDAIVVLGAPLGPTLDERVRAGVELWHRGLAPRMILSGIAPEAPAMARLASALGVPANALWIEDRSRSTQENALRSAELMRAAGLRSAVVVTTPYHLRRAMAFFRRAGIDASPHFIADSRIFRGGKASARALRWIVREYLLLAHYRLRGEL